MPNTIQHKRSSTPAAVPNANALAAGELAVNTADGRVYMKKNDGSVVDVAATRSHTHDEYLARAGGTMTGAVQVVAGTASAPGVAVSGDTNTGIAQIGGADTIGVVTGGVERLRVGSDGAAQSVIPGGSTLYPAFFCRAWVNFNGTGTVAIRASGNVTSITDHGVGNYTVNLTTAMPDANYAIAGAVDQTLASSWFHYETIVSVTADSFRILCARIDNGSLTADPAIVRYAIFR